MFWRDFLTLALAKKERLKRLRTLAEKAGTFPENEPQAVKGMSGKKEFYERFGEIEDLFASPLADDAVERSRYDFLSMFDGARRAKTARYIDVIQALDGDVSAMGVAWLQGIVDGYCDRARAIAPSLFL